MTFAQYIAYLRDVMIVVGLFFINAALWKIATLLDRNVGPFLDILRRLK